MKKLLLTILTFTLTCCAFLFSGCNRIYAGTYKLNGLSYLENETTHKVALGEKYEGEIFKEDLFILTINRDNTAVMRICEDDEIESMVFQWTKGYQNEIYLFTLENGESIIFKKADNGYVLDFYDIELLLAKN